jgi:predicted Ser/Thr protein kinase
MGEPDDEDPRLANTFMPPDGDDPADGEEDPRLANTFMAPDEAPEGEEDPRLANTFMPHDEAPEGQEDPRLANTYMPGEEDPNLTQTAGVVPLDPDHKDMKATRVDSVQARGTAHYGHKPSLDETLGGGPASDDVAPDMTFMDDGGGYDYGEDANDQTFADASLDEQSADMTFMDTGGGGGMDDQGADMTFMDAGGGGGGGGMDDQGADMTFMDAGGGGGDLDDSVPGEVDIPTMLEPQTGGGLDDLESDHTFVSLDSQEGMVSSPSLSGSRSQTQLRTQRFQGKVAMNVEDDGLFAGKYKLLGELARGGMGVVYKALHVDLNQIVALKLMLAGSHASDDHRRRFLFEAEASARLKHANIVPVFDVGTVEDNLYFTMAFVKGAELKERKEELTRDQLLDVMIKVTDAISFAHQRGIIHRDLKPANIMMTEGDEPLVMDFGLAKQLDEQEKEDEALEDSELAKTTEGAIMGTPYYMSPEQAQGMTHEIDTRTDTYALGVILYQLWTKKLPFTARRATEILQKIVKDEAERPRQVDESVPQDMEAIILKAMNKAPDDRYASAAALKEDLLKFKNGDPVSAQRATMAYRFRKWAQKNKQQLIAASIVFTVLLGSIIALGYQNYAERQRQAEQVTLAIAGAKGELEKLDLPVKGLTADVTSLLATSSGEIPVRAEQLTQLSDRRAALREKLRAAGQPLGPYVGNDLRAGEAQSLADDLRRTLEAQREELARLQRVHTSLEEGASRLGELEGKLPSALAAIGSATKAQPVEFANLEEAIALGRDLLQKANNLGDSISLGEALDAQREALDQERKALQVKVYGGLAEAPAESPESLRAREILRSSDAVIARLDAERAGSNQQRVARELFGVSQAIQPLLAVTPPKVKKSRRLPKECRQCQFDLSVRMQPKFATGEEVLAHVAKEHALHFPLPARPVRSSFVTAARISRDLNRRAIQLMPDPEFIAAISEKNRSYLLTLLYLQAYKLFDLAIQEPGPLPEGAREALVAGKVRQLEQRGYLMRRLIAADAGGRLDLVKGKMKVRGKSNTGAQMLSYMSLISSLKKLGKDPLLDDELDQVRLAKLAKNQKRVEELKKELAKERAERKAKKAREKAAREKAAREKAAREKGTTDAAPE